MLIPTHRLQWMFWLKTVTVLPTCLIMVIWISVKAGKGGDFFNQPPTVHGSERAWLWISSLTSITGGFSTLAVNISDFSRFSKHRSSHLWQLPMIPFFKCIVAVFGVVSASAASQLYGKVIWSPLGIIAMWQGTPGGRAAAFFASAVWCLAQICVNISANSVSFGNGELRVDMMRRSIANSFDRYHQHRPKVLQPQARSRRLRHLRRLGIVRLFLEAISLRTWADFWQMPMDHHSERHCSLVIHVGLCLLPRTNCWHHVKRLLDCQEAPI